MVRLESHNGIHMTAPRKPRGKAYIRFAPTPFLVLLHEERAG
jgi:hypothetical protein